jgi:hypothetical protein
MRVGGRQSRRETQYWRCPKEARQGGKSGAWVSQYGNAAVDARMVCTDAERTPGTAGRVSEATMSDAEHHLSERAGLELANGSIHVFLRHWSCRFCLAKQRTILSPSALRSQSVRLRERARTREV